MHRRIMKCTAVMMTCIPAHTLYCSFRDDTLAQDARRPCERARSRARARALSLSLSLSRSRSLSRSHDTRAHTQAGQLTAELEEQGARVREYQDLLQRTRRGLMVKAGRLALRCARSSARSLLVAWSCQVQHISKVF